METRWKKQGVSKAIVALSGLAMFTACTSSDGGHKTTADSVYGQPVDEASAGVADQTTVDLTDLVNGTGTAANRSQLERAEEIAGVAEGLMRRNTFMYANEIARMALKLDPENRTARLIVALTGPGIVAKGLLGRIEPLAAKSPAYLADYKDAVEKLSLSKQFDAAKYILDGPSDIDSEKDLQQVIALQTIEVDKLRQELNKQKQQGSLTSRIYIELPALWTRGSNLKQDPPVCSVRHISETKFTFRNCRSVAVKTVSISPMDFEIAAQYAGGVQISVALANTYRADDAVATGIHHRHFEKFNHGSILERLFQERSFGKLRSARTLGAVPEVLSSFSLGLRNSLAVREKLCSPTGEAGNPDSWQGELIIARMLLQNGNDTSSVRTVYCKDVESPFAEVRQSRVRDLVRLADKASFGALGQTVDIDYSVRKFTMTGDYSYTQTAKVNIVNFVNQTVEDARVILPLQTDVCGQITHFADGNLNGLFPTGDLNTILADAAVRSEEATQNCIAHPRPHL